MELLPHRPAQSTTADMNYISNTTDYSNVTPNTAHQPTSTVQSLSQDTNIEESVSALTISEDMATWSRHTDAQSKEAVSENQDSIVITSKCNILHVPWIQYIQCAAISLKKLTLILQCFTA